MKTFLTQGNRDMRWWSNKAHVFPDGRWVDAERCVTQMSELESLESPRLVSVDLSMSSKRI